MAPSPAKKMTPARQAAKASCKYQTMNRWGSAGGDINKEFEGLPGSRSTASTSKTPKEPPTHKTFSRWSWEPSRSWSAPDFVDPDEPDSDPGPGSYECFSGFGRQGEARRPTAPCYSFLPKHEKSWSKVFITKGHQGATAGRDGPGAIYKPKLTSSEASVNFPKGERKSPANITSGPGKFYDVRDEPNKAAQAKNHRTDFGTHPRFVIPGQNSKPNIAPGQYEIKGALDMGLKAKSFGTSFRAYDKVLLNSDQHLVNLGRASPGPGHYRQDFGKDGFSFAMGKDMKLRPVKLSDTPENVGPGVYRPENVVSLEGSALSSTRNPCATPFGNPRRKRGRFDFKKLDQCGPRVWTSTW